VEEKMHLNADSGDARTPLPLTTGVLGELSDGYTICPSGNCGVLEWFERKTPTELAGPVECPSGCGSNLELVLLKNIEV
jgi:hypothetical protein